MNLKENIKFINDDCMNVMRDYPDNYFDLAIVDPPYGIGIDGQKESICKNPKHNRKEHKKKGWDSSSPDENYFKELFRISENQIIWGANYYPEFLTKSKGWIVWFKGQTGLTMSDCELAFSSIDTPTRVININRAYIQRKGGSIHPTQKPVKLYQWLLENYSKPTDKILDTHLGSGSHAIAAHYFGVSEFVGIELDKEYFDASVKRFKDQTAQVNIFQEIEQQQVEQTKLL